MDDGKSQGLILNYFSANFRGKIFSICNYNVITLVYTM